MLFRCRESAFPRAGIVTTIGSALILISLALDFSYSNLSIYVLSYIRRYDGSVTYADWIYITVARTFVQSCLMPFTGVLERHIGSRMCILIGSIIYSTSIACTYFLIDYGFVPLIFSLSISHGIAFSLMYAQAIGSVIKWFLSGNQGLMSSIAIGGYGFGAVIWIPLQTAFVNPQNIEAISVTNDTNADKYFMEHKLLDRVPYLFLLLGGIFATFQMIGLLLIRPAKHTYLEETTSLRNEQPAVSGIENAKDLSMKDTLKTSQFWLLWIFMGMIQLTASFVYTYQKGYGIKFINDDAFFSFIGVASNILNGSSRIIWGKIYDWKGFKPSALMVASVTTLSSVAFVLMQYLPADELMLKKVIFTILSVLFYGFYPGLYTIIAPTIQNTFGHLNYARDYGLLFTQSMVAGSILLIVTTFLFDLIHFQGMFLLSGLFGIIGILAVIKFKEA